MDLIFGAEVFSPASTNTHSVPSRFCMMYTFTKMSFIRHTPGAISHTFFDITLSSVALFSRFSTNVRFIFPFFDDIIGEMNK
jgi:hypothetical protein